MAERDRYLRNCRNGKQNQIKDNLNDILRRENYSRGVVVRQEDNGIAVDVYTIVSYGTKISEVSRNVQEKVKYNLETLLGVTANSVNVLFKEFVYYRIRGSVLSTMQLHKEVVCCR